VTVVDVPARGRKPARLMTLAGGTRLFLRRLRLQPGAPLAMVALVGTTCFLFAALPRLFNSFADDSLRYQVAQAAPLARNVLALQWNRLPGSGGAEPLIAVGDRAERLQGALPPSLRELIAERAFVVRSPRYVLRQDPQANVDPGLTRYLNFRVQSGVDPHLRLVSGRFPGGSSEHVRARITNEFSDDVPGLAPEKEVPLLEVALSTTNAELLHLRVGDRVVFSPDEDDLVVQGVPFRELQPLAIDVVGLFTVKDPQGSFWFGDGTLDTPYWWRSQDLELTRVYGQALVSSKEYARMLAATRPLSLAYEYRYFVAASRLDAGQLPRLRGDLAGLDARYQAAGPLETRIETGLTSVFDEYRVARSQAEALLAVVVIALLVCALANVALLGTLSHDRRRVETGLSRTRGAAPGQVLGAQAAEAVVLALPAGLAGWVLAMLVVEARASSASAWLALAIVAGTVVLLVAAIADQARRPLEPLGRDDGPLTRPSRRRLMLEGLVVVTAGLGVFLLRRRGLDVSAPGPDGEFDPYLAGAPVLLALALGIVAARLYPVCIAGAARLAQRGRALSLHLGLSRVARQPDLSAAPLLVVVLALAVAVFSSAMLRTLEAGQDRTSWRTVGADVRVDAPEDESLPPPLVSRLQSLGGVARAYVQDAGLATGSERTLVTALDLDAYEKVVAGGFVLDLPSELRTEAPVPGVVPAVVSTNWPGGGFFQIDLRSGSVGVLAVAERASFPGFPSDTPFAIVSLQALEKAGGPLPPSRVYVRDASAAAIREVVQDEAPRAEISSRSATVGQLRASPFVERTLQGFRAAVVLAGVYAGLAVVLMALIAARSRSRDLALVRTLGASTREALALAAVELTPFVAAALVLGIGLGIAVSYVIAPGLDLGFYTGDPSNPIVVPWRFIAAIAAALVVVVAATVLLVGLRARRARLDRVLRIGER
jgi:putative ABC transport system permease protein